jgi:hypothetical protein
MGTITTAAIIGKAQTILQDVTGTRWNSTELLGWLNSGQREIILYKPNANAKAAVIKLTAGTRQALPSDGVQLVDIIRNMGTNGTTPGRVIRQTARDTLDAALPTWHSVTADAVVRHYIFNFLDPKAFYVYPPQPAVNQGYIEMIYGALPTDATANGTISVDDIYENLLLDYVLYRAFSKETEFSDQSAANVHYAAFMAALTGKAKTELGLNPSSAAPANTTTVS